MQFESLLFLVCLVGLCALFWSFPSRWQTLRKVILLVASYGFYGLLDWRFPVFLLLATVSAYVCGAYLLKFEGERPRRGKPIVIGYVAVCIVLLFIFKYLTFFAGSFASVFGQQGPTFRLLLPIGLSFYLFMSVSYVIDCYRKTITKTPTLLDFSVYVGFFPHLVAGPIDRARNFIPQLSSIGIFDSGLFTEGLRQMLYGYFKKLVIADNLNVIVGAVWSSYDQQNSLVILVGAIAYSIQIYTDFSGYSDIAIGTGKLFGIRMMRNFSFPYFSRTVSEFWRGWHISLTSWFTEYLYIPLGGNRKGTRRTIFNTLVVFTLCGLWHGANWTFVVWGFLCGVLFIPLLLNAGSKARWKSTPLQLNAVNIGHMMLVFGGITLCWIFFRSDSLAQAFDILRCLVVNVGRPVSFGFISITMAPVFFLLLLMFVCMEWAGHSRDFGLLFVQGKPRLYRWSVYVVLLFAIFFYFHSGDGQFIYQNF